MLPNFSDQTRIGVLLGTKKSQKSPPGPTTKKKIKKNPSNPISSATLEIQATLDTFSLIF
jgi:hypothetical protein